ncbi:MAG: prepilin-type N-terminal cleavage/methylation domain-containing protein [Candidatus Vogelbacteria bacterium]|nr:prepilin-type N-terminal cleavage/methylation domain-containing protein [Candidatus Vogelbacteria bacterium]
MTTPPSSSGFTLLETLVAITILIIGVLGPLTLAVNGIVDGLYAKNQITANFLAVEGMEKIVNLRNSDVATNDFTDFANIDAAPLAGGPNGLSELLLYNTGTNFYDTNGAVGPLFTRLTTVETIGPDERKITVKVSWKNKLADKSLELVDYLYAY